MVGKNDTCATWHTAAECHPLFRQDPGQVLMNIVAEGQHWAEVASEHEGLNCQP